MRKFLILCVAGFGLAACSTLNGLETDITTGAGLFATASNPSTPPATAQAAWTKLVGLIQSDNPQVQAIANSVCGAATTVAGVDCSSLTALEAKVNAEVAALSATSAPQTVAAAFQDLQAEAVIIKPQTVQLSAQTQADLQAAFNFVQAALPLIVSAL